jgi:coenzyme PQQ precursor peptide PqqA
MEWETPEFETFELSAEMTAYAGHWTEVEAGDEAPSEEVDEP